MGLDGPYIVFLCTVTILPSGDFQLCGCGRHLFARVSGFPLPNHFLVFSVGLISFTVLPNCCLYASIIVALHLLYGNWLDHLHWIH